MSKIYAGQTDFSLILDLSNYGVLTDTTIVLRISYPNGTITDVTSANFTITGNNLEWKPSVDAPLVFGKMKFWVRITRNSRVISSEPIELNISLEGY